MWKHIVLRREYSLRRNKAYSDPAWNKEDKTQVWERTSQVSVSKPQHF